MTCNRTKGTYLLTHCLLPYSHECLINDLKDAGVFSILCDKATDISMSMKKFLCINVRFILKATKTPCTRFYRLLKEGNASGVFDAISSSLHEDGLDLSLVSGYGSDGENLIQGAGNSVLTKFQDAAPGLFVLKCYCHSFNLVAEHANRVFIKPRRTVQNVYNYFKMSPNRQKSLLEFQEFAQTEPHKILKPCQTRWLSLHQCCRRILEQWPALLLFFTSEVFAQRGAAGADRILQALKTPYIKATVVFCDFVLGDLCAVNIMLQANSFQLHNLVPECERIIKIFCGNFRKPVSNVETVDVDDEIQWLPLKQVHPELSASETIKNRKPHEKEGYLKRCRDWYREAVRQILFRIDFSNPLYDALKDVEPNKIMDGTARVHSGAVIAKSCPRIVTNLKAELQVLDRERRSFLVDDKIKSLDANDTVESFWKKLSAVPVYNTLATFILAILSLPQSTAEVERTFSKLNNNKTRLRTLS